MRNCAGAERREREDRKRMLRDDRGDGKGVARGTHTRANVSVMRGGEAWII